MVVKWWGHRNEMWLFHTRITISNPKKNFEARGDERYSSNTFHSIYHSIHTVIDSLRIILYTVKACDHFELYSF